MNAATGMAGPAGLLALASLAPAQPAMAQFVHEDIVGGAHEIVDGGGPAGTGNPPSTRDSVWEFNGRLAIGGYAGPGELTIRNGGVVRAGAGDLARGADGVVTVTGPGSLLEFDGFFYVGEWNGNGMLTVEDGARVDSYSGIIGTVHGTWGNAVIRGPGSTWTTEGDTIVGDTGAGTLTVQDGGSFTAQGSINLALFPSASGTLNIGAPEGSPAAAPGTFEVMSVSFRQGQGTLVFNHTAQMADSYIFGADLNQTSAGVHELRHLAGVTNYTGNGAPFTGPTTVSGGALYVDGSLEGSVIDVTGGTLGGGGTVGTSTIHSGSILAAGTAIGTLTVAGDLTFMPGAFFDVEVDDASQTADRVEVTGTATLAGTVRVDAYQSGQTNGQTYTILSAADLVNQFESEVVHDYAFLTPILEHDAAANEVRLTFERSISEGDFREETSTPNQGAAADGVESLREGNELHEVVVNLPQDAVEPAFEALSGEIHASARSALIEDSRFPRQAINDRLRDALGSGGGDAALAQNTTPFDGVDFWGRAYGDRGHIGGDGNATHLDSTTIGLFFGADAQLAPDWRLGVMAGYGRTGFSSADRASSGSSDNYHLGLYGGGQWENLALRGGIAHTWHDIETRRDVVIPNLADDLTGRHDARTFQAFGELGYALEIDDHTRIEPFVGLAHVHHSTSSFTEQGGPAVLHVEGDSAGVTFATLGVRGEHDLDLGDVEATLYGSVGWRHAFGDLQPQRAHTFPGGDPFNITGAPLARDSAIIEAGIDFDLAPDAALGLSYTGQFGDGTDHHGVNARLSLRF